MTVRQIRVWETDTLEVIWQFADGSSFKQSFTVPPRATREARQVIERTEENASGQKM